jgi:DNA uptake protein ComE-like DNA-binding protein
MFWMIGRGDPQDAPSRAVFGLVDEASKLNLNTATREMLEYLPRMTPELAAAIVDWRDSDSTVGEGGAEDEIYLRLDPPYRCKNARFESIEELRLVYGMDIETLYGEDTNLNGVLDPNENDGDLSPPSDNRDGRLDPGLIEYLTIFSREPNTGADGSQRINVGSTNQTQLASLLQENFGADRANQILRQVGTSATNTSVLQFYMRSGMTAAEFARIETNITTSSDAMQEGLVNVNTASEAVLACIPGIGPDNAASLVTHRMTATSEPGSIAWVTEVLDQQSAIQAGPYITGRTCQVAADIAAVGRHGRGYQRVRFVFDTSEGAPKIISRRDLTHLGWALGREARDYLQLVRRTK